MVGARVVLTGSTGGLGSAVLRHILGLVDPSSIIVSLFNPSKQPSQLAELGVEVRRGDYADPQSLETAFAGANILFLVSYPSIAHELRVKSHVNCIDAAKRAGIEHVFYTSLAFAGPHLSSTSVAAVMRAHLDTEAYLKNSGFKYTIIREGIYSESYPLYLGFFDPSSNNDTVFIPDDGDDGITWASREELGEATARLISATLKGEKAAVPVDNHTILFSGPKVVSLASLAEILSTILQRPITITRVTPEEYYSSSTVLSRLGVEFAKLWATTYEALKRGECAVVDPSLELILNRKPKNMETILRALLGDAGSAKGTIDQYAK